MYFESIYTYGEYLFSVLFRVSKQGFKTHLNLLFEFARICRHDNAQTFSHKQM